MNSNEKFHSQLKRVKSVWNSIHELHYIWCIGTQVKINNVLIEDLMETCDNINFLTLSDRCVFFKGILRYFEIMTVPQQKIHDAIERLYSKFPKACKAFTDYEKIFCKQTSFFIKEFKFLTNLIDVAV